MIKQIKKPLQAISSRIQEDNSCVVVAKVSEESKHLARIITWYEGGTGVSYNDTMLGALRWLRLYLPFKPESKRKTLYRALYVPASKYDGLVSGKFYKLSRGANPLVCFTTSTERAHKFKKFVKRNDAEAHNTTVIVSVKADTVTQLTSLPWMQTSVSMVLKDKLPEDAVVQAKKLSKLLRSYHIVQEDEILCKTPALLHVKLESL